MSLSGLRATFEKLEILPTPQRLEVASILLEKPQHLSADQIIERLRLNGSAVSKATVYNTLGLFTEKGLIKVVIVDPSKVFYDSNISNHHHFYDVDSGTLHDIAGDNLAIQQMPEPPETTTIKHVEVIVRVTSKAS